MAVHGNRRSHLGSARITLDNAARVIESRSYSAFGDELTSSGTGARTSYIGRETDSKVNDRLTGSAIFYFVHNLPR